MWHYIENVLMLVQAIDDPDSIAASRPIPREGQSQNGKWWCRFILWLLWFSISPWPQLTFGLHHSVGRTLEGHLDQPAAEFRTWHKTHWDLAWKEPWKFPSPAKPQHNALQYHPLGLVNICTTAAKSCMVLRAVQMCILYIPSLFSYGARPWLFIQPSNSYRHRRWSVLPPHGYWQ